MAKINLNNEVEFSELLLAILYKADVMPKADVLRDFLERSNVSTQLRKAWQTIDPDRRVDLKRLMPMLKGKSSSDTVILIKSKGGKEKGEPGKIGRIIRKLLQSQDYSKQNLSKADWKQLHEHFGLEPDEKYVTKNICVKYL